jgi:YfiH family protein
MLELAKFDFGSVTVTALSRNGGVSKFPYDTLNLSTRVGDQPEAVASNLSKVQRLIKAQGLAILQAEHGVKVHQAIRAGEAAPGDGLVCTKPGLGIIALSADCVPFALVDPIAKVIAVGHAGWRGVLADLMSQLSKSFVKSGGDITQSTAILGPAICGSCYEVPGDRVKLFKKSNPDAILDKTHLDISAGVRAKLNELGYKTNQVLACTYEETKLFSYRRVGGGPTGRTGLAAVIK